MTASVFGIVSHGRATSLPHQLSPPEDPPPPGLGGETQHAGLEIRSRCGFIINWGSCERRMTTSIQFGFVWLLRDTDLTYVFFWNVYLFCVCDNDFMIFKLNVVICLHRLHCCSCSFKKDLKWAAWLGYRIVYYYIYAYMNICIYTYMYRLYTCVGMIIFS